MNKKEDRLNVYSRAGLIFLAIFTAMIALAISIYYYRQPILEYYSFRQTQTAISSYWMLHEGWMLNYQTPVGGYPWSIPFEFPIYQTIVALIAYISGFPLDPVGRFVSLLFLLACGLPAFSIARRLRLPSEVPLVFSALLWSSPIYLFWGRTFMIETATIFFVFAAIPYAIDLLDEMPNWRSAVLFLFWMSLGMLQKITTALPVMIVFSLLIAIAHFRTHGLRLPGWQKIIRVLVAFAVPVLLAGIWSYYTDFVREQNVLGLEMTSKSLMTWNFGTMQQRLDLKMFTEVIWNRVFVKNLAGIVGFLTLGAALFLGDRRIKMLLFISLVLFLLPIEIFINLNIEHDYYQASSCLFIIGGLAIAIVGLSQKIKLNTSFTIFIMTLAFVMWNLYAYQHSYWVLLNTMQSSLNKPANRTLLVSSILNKYTTPNSTIVIFGMEWSSEIAYYSERKSFTVPRWLDRPDWPGKPDWQRKYDEIWKNPEPYLGDTPLGALVFCNGEDGRFEVKQILTNQFVEHQPRLFNVSGCYIWLPNVDKIVLPGMNQVILPANY